MRTGEIALERIDTGLAVLTISGEHDLNTASELRGQLDRALETGQPLVVDLTPASFIDSSILGVILDARRRAEDRGTGFALCRANGEGAVSRLLEVTGLRGELPVHPSREQAEGAATSSGEPAR